MENKRYKRKIIRCELEEGFFYIPKELKSDLYFSKEEQVLINFEGHINSFKYNLNKLIGVKDFYREKGIDNGDLLFLRAFDKTLYISRNEEEILPLEELEITDCIQQTNNLSNTVKGNIAEDRIKEYILFHGQELLNVYKPVIDRNGVDFIVMQDGFYYPIYLQIKSRYSLTFENLDTKIYLSEKTFTSHDTFYIVCVYFNENTLEVLEDILFIPSKIVEEKAIKKDGKMQLSISFLKEDKNEWCKYLVNKTQLVNKLLKEISFKSEIADSLFEIINKSKREKV